jgi:hypothetical protein
LHRLGLLFQSPSFFAALLKHSYFMATLTVHSGSLTKQHVHAAHESTWHQYSIKLYGEVVTGTCDYFPIKLKSVLVPGTRYLAPLSTYSEASKPALVPNIEHPIRLYHKARNCAGAWHHFPIKLKAVLATCNKYLLPLLAVCVKYLIRGHWVYTRQIQPQGYAVEQHKLLSAQGMYNYRVYTLHVL